MFVRMARISFDALPCRERNLMTARFCWNRARRLTCFRDCFFPGRAKDLSASRYSWYSCMNWPFRRFTMLIQRNMAKYHSSYLLVFHGDMICAQRYTNPGRQVVRVAKFCTVAPNICRPLVWSLLHFIILAPEILRWLLDSWKTCLSLAHRQGVPQDRLIF